MQPASGELESGDSVLVTSTVARAAERGAVAIRDKFYSAGSNFWVTGNKLYATGADNREASNNIGERRNNIGERRTNIGETRCVVSIRRTNFSESHRNNFKRRENPREAPSLPDDEDAGRSGMSKNQRRLLTKAQQGHDNLVGDDAEKRTLSSPESERDATRGRDSSPSTGRVTTRPRTRRAQRRERSTGRGLPATRPSLKQTNRCLALSN